jgi:hypothetical protein
MRAASGRNVGFGRVDVSSAPDILYSNRKFRVSSGFRARCDVLCTRAHVLRTPVEHMQEKSPRRHAAGFSIVCESISA